MKQLIKRPCVVVFAVFACVCVILALCVQGSANNVFDILGAPLQSVGNFIREISLGGKAAGGWCIFFLIGVLPLVFPIIKTVARRKFYPLSLVWVALSAYLLVMLFFLINPHLLNNNLVGNAQEEAVVLLRETTVAGMQVTFWAIAAVCVLCELFSFVNSGNRAYLCAKLMVYALALCSIFAAFFGATVVAKKGLNAVDSAKTLLNLNVPLNKFATIFSLLCNYVPTVVTVALIVKCGVVIDSLKTDAFSRGNAESLCGVTKLCKLSVFVTLGCLIANNVLQLCLSPQLLNAHYSVTIPLAEVLIVCLLMIFAEILKRAVEIKEENDLTI
ncbi:MAG: DUF2975 domain-containing protein [Candidatus Fimimonas sp.]